MMFMVVILVAGGTLFLGWLSPISFAIGKPDHVAEVLVLPERVSISVALNVASPIGLAEYYRRLTVTTAGGRAVSHDLALDTGGYPSVNVYRRSDGALVIAGPLDGLVQIYPAKPAVDIYDTRPKARHVGAVNGICGSFKPHETGRTWDGLKESMYLSEHFYVGRFDFVARGDWQFAEGGKIPEYVRSTGGGDFWDPDCR